MSEEHVLPQWVRNVIPGGKQSDWIGGRASDGQVDREYTGRMAIAREKVVCESCNTGWMSDLEDAIKPVLTPLMMDTPQLPPLSAVEQDLLARWAFKTASVADEVYRFKRKSHVAPGLALSFGATNGSTMPDRTTVLLARSDPTETIRDDRARTVDAYSDQFEIVRRAEVIGHLFRAVIRVRSVAFVIFCHDVPGLNYSPLEVRETEPLLPYVRQIYPTLERTLRFPELPSIASIGGIGALVGHDRLSRGELVRRRPHNRP